MFTNKNNKPVLEIKNDKKPALEIYMNRPDLIHSRLEQIHNHFHELPVDSFQVQIQLLQHLLSQHLRIMQITPDELTEEVSKAKDIPGLIKAIQKKDKTICAIGVKGREADWNKFQDILKTLGKYFPAMNAAKKSASLSTSEPIASKEEAPQSFYRNRK